MVDGQTAPMMWSSTHCRRQSVDVQTAWTMEIKRLKFFIFITQCTQSTINSIPHKKQNPNTQTYSPPTNSTAGEVSVLTNEDETETPTENENEKEKHSTHALAAPKII